MTLNQSIEHILFGYEAYERTILCRVLEFGDFRNHDFLIEPKPDQLVEKINLEHRIQRKRLIQEQKY